jgi:hypothetical protein
MIVGSGFIHIQGKLPENSKNQKISEFTRDNFFASLHRLRPIEHIALAVAELVLPGIRCLITHPRRISKLKTYSQLLSLSVLFCVDRPVVMSCFRDVAFEIVKLVTRVSVTGMVSVFLRVILWFEETLADSRIGRSPLNLGWRIELF